MDIVLFIVAVIAGYAVSVVHTFKIKWKYSESLLRIEEEYNKGLIDSNEKLRALNHELCNELDNNIDSIRKLNDKIQHLELENESYKKNYNSNKNLGLN